jgi:adenylate cyclase
MTPENNKADETEAFHSPLHRFASRLIGRKGRPAAAIAVLFMAVVFALTGPIHWQPVRNAVFDTYQKHFPRAVSRFPIVIVDIDDQSLAAVGRWPWPRTYLAALTEAVHDLGAKAVGYDIIMPEPDNLSPDVVLAQRADVDDAIRDALSEIPSNDAILATVLRRSPSVLGRAALLDAEAHSREGTAQTPAMVVGVSPVSYLTSYGAHLANIPILEEASFGRGYLNDTRDPDGVVRSMPIVLSVNGQTAPSMALELLRTGMGQNWYSIHADEKGIKGVQLGESFIPTDSDGRIHLYFSQAYSERRVSAISILNGELSKGAFDGQVAIIGVTGVGTIDVATTPVAARMDGVEIQAQVVENLLDNARCIRPEAGLWIEIGALMVVAVLFTALVPRMPLGYGILSFLTATVMLIVSSIAIFQHARLQIDPTIPVAGNAVVIAILFTAGYAETIRKRRELNAALAAERLERVRISGELQAAREIQLGILPSPDAIEGLPSRTAFYAMLEPAAAVGGDLYDAFMIDKNHLFFIVGDVAGKGVAASLFMALSKTLCKSTVLGSHQPLGKAISKVNQEISRENPSMLFVTAVAGILDIDSGAVAICRAGHDAPILLPAEADARTLDIDGGPPLCVLEDYAYEDARFQLTSGDMLVMISDGVTEANNPEEALYGKERISRYLNRLPRANRRAEWVCKGLYEDIQKFTRGSAQADDITIMAVQFVSPEDVPD